MLGPASALSASLSPTLRTLHSNLTPQTGDHGLPPQRLVTLGDHLSQDLGMAFVVHDGAFLTGW